MNGGPSIFAVCMMLSMTLSMTLSMKVQADDSDFMPSEIGAEVLNNRQETNSHTFGLRAYTIISDDLSAPDTYDSAPQNGVVIDYYPFESGFRVSAGAFASDSKKVYASGELRRAYVGVGWKKLLDDAERVDFSVDVGTFLDTGHEKTESAVSESTANPSLQGTKADSKEQPVISLGVKFRF
ncbi:hypothetical protein [Endozoicomonas sp. 4G]|uniref:hypothetical protein n=1 Tax=Endozoicomonas sp. 4G TaxID=2872754 RepID=UPI002078B88D|nr:hypothetical protein [Endozoicomonas sp. 4G]